MLVIHWLLFYSAISYTTAYPRGWNPFSWSQVANTNNAAASSPSNSNSWWNPFKSTPVSSLNPFKSTPASSSSSTSASPPTPQELNNLCTAFQKLWSLDTNRLIPGKDFNINLQRPTRVFQMDDKDSQPLFQAIPSTLLTQRPTFDLFMKLSTHYHAQTGTTETTTPQEMKLESSFLDAVLSSLPGSYLEQYLIAKKYVTNKEQVKKLLMNVWFDLYRRKVENDSSAFEHTFVGELSNGQVTGFHNWIQFMLEEQAKRANYHGWIAPRNKQSPLAKPTGKEPFLSFQFSWKNKVKKVSSFILGSSPEFEMALYTLQFLLKRNQPTQCNLGGYPVIVKSHTLNTQKGPRLGASYIELN